jgi:nucleoid-associated protein YgaU
MKHPVDGVADARILMRIPQRRNIEEQNMSAHEELKLLAVARQIQSAGRYAKARRHLLSEADANYAHVSHAPEWQRAAADTAELARMYLFELIGVHAA